MKINPLFLVIGIGVVGFALLVLVFSSSSQSNTNNTGFATNNVSNENPVNLQVGVEKGNLAPDFSLNTVEGNTVRLSDFKGKYVLFASMATWCTPCRIEAENVKRAQDNFEHLPLIVMQIDVDSRETNQDLIKFREQLGKDDWLMGFDDGSFSQLYKIRTFDTTLLVDPQGVIVYRDNGFPMDTKTLEDLIIKGESSKLELGSIHEHAKIQVFLDGEKVDFSQDKYQLRSSFVHFEESDGEEVHLHAKGVTLRYLFETFGWNAKDCLKTDFGNFCNEAIKVDGKNSNLDHEIREGENIEARYTS